MSHVLSDLHKCDVKNQEKFLLFIEKRRQWRSAMVGDDGQSIKNQVNLIVCDDAVFRLLNEARRLNEQQPSSERGFNCAAFSLFDRVFLANQVTAIRRLADPGFQSSDKEAISLVRVLNDMEKHHSLFTRENYVCCDGGPYDFPANRSRDLDHLHWDIRHKNFDRLSGVAKQHRQRNDAIDRGLFKRLKDKLLPCDDFRLCANKFIAESASVANGRHPARSDCSVVLNKVDDAYRAIIQVASFVGAILLYEHTVGQVPALRYDHLENLDKPMVSIFELDCLSAQWYRRRDIVDQWRSGIWPD